MEFRRASTRGLELPVLHCPEGRFACVEDRVYGQVYELNFTLERLVRKTDGYTTERVNRGRLLVAVDLSPQDKDALEDGWRDEVRALSAAAFSWPQAGMGFLRGALSTWLLKRSTRPAWVCDELAGEFGAHLLVPRDDEKHSTHGATGEVAARGCESIIRALEGASPEILLTGPNVEAEERIEVRLRSASTLDGLTWSDRLAPLPVGATLSKRALDGDKTGMMWNKQGDAFRGHEGRDGKIQREVLMPSASLELLEMPMWISEWRFETTRESFGKEPMIAHDSPVSIVMAVVPVVDPLMSDLARARIPLSVPEERIVDANVARFESSSRLETELVVAALADRQVWPERGDWLVVICRDDGTARYGIAPFPAVALVTNPLDSCSAIRREFE